MNKTVRMVCSKETKGTLVYQELTQSGSAVTDNRMATFPTIYVQKTSELGIARPDEIEVTVTWK